MYVFARSLIGRRRCFGSNICFSSFKSPSDSEPTFRFPNKTDSLNIPGNGNKQHVTESASLPKKIPVVFRYAIGQHKTIKEVYLIGTFTSWKDKVPMAKSDGEFVTIVDLPEGEHQYKFVVDGKWEHDPNQVRNVFFAPTMHRYRHIACFAVI